MRTNIPAISPSAQPLRPSSLHPSPQRIGQRLGGLLAVLAALPIAGQAEPANEAFSGPGEINTANRLALSQAWPAAAAAEMARFAPDAAINATPVMVAMDPIQASASPIRPAPPSAQPAAIPPASPLLVPQLSLTWPTDALQVIPPTIPQLPQPNR